MHNLNNATWKKKENWRLFLILSSSAPRSSVDPVTAQWVWTKIWRHCSEACNKHWSFLSNTKWPQCRKVRIQTVNSSGNKRNSSERLRLGCSRLAVQPDGVGETRWAELQADNFRKLWAELDKEIRACAYPHWQRLMGGRSFTWF